MHPEKQSNKLWLVFLIASSIFFFIILLLATLSFVKEPKITTTKPPDLGRYNELGKTIYRYLPGWKVPYKWEYDNQLIASSGKDITLIRGRPIEVWVEFKNTGQKTWYRDIYNGDLNNIVYLATDMPAAHPSRWAQENKGNWNKWRNIVYLDQKEVAPGEIGSFHFQISVDPRAPTGTYKEYFRMARGDFSVFGEYIEIGNIEIEIPPIWKQFLLILQKNVWFRWGGWLFIAFSSLYLFKDLCLNKSIQALLLLFWFVGVFAIVLAIFIYLLAYFFYFNYPVIIADGLILSFYLLIIGFIFKAFEYLISLNPKTK